MRLENCRSSLPAPVSLWHRVRLAVLLFGAWCFFMGFAAGRVEADTIPASRLVSLSYTSGCVPASFVYSGAESGLKAAFESFFNAGSCAVSNGPVVATLSPSTLILSWVWSVSGATGSRAYTVTGYSCPSGYYLSGTNCVSVSALTPEQEVAILWLIANKSALENVMNNQSTLVAQAFEPDVAGQFFAWGFTLVILVGIAAWGGGQLMGFINRIFYR
jgi:hypothetical protein